MIPYDANTANIDNLTLTPVFFAAGSNSSVHNTRLHKVQAGVIKWAVIVMYERFLCASVHMSLVKEMLPLSL